MKRDLTQYADRSCWISGDRVNACIGDGRACLVEFGFHGAQPVSRNSRMLVRPDGVLTLTLRMPEGNDFPVAFEQVEWAPHHVVGVVHTDRGRIDCEFIATARAVHVCLRGARPGTDLIARASFDACFADVRGERTWDPPRTRGGLLTLSCRDRITLGPWMRQKGPYAGDFLIPEHWRRVIFDRPIRSGLATIDDLRPEFRDADIPLYDARTWIMMGSQTGSCTVENGWATFVIPAVGSDADVPVFTIEGSDNDPADTTEPRSSRTDVVTVRRGAEHADRTATRMACAALPELSAFVGILPGLVRSCTVEDVGMVRATPGSYYWLWAWDALVTGQECLRWGANDTAGSIVRYVNAHRDVDGRIPVRWTRAHEPMDTPPHGALEFLLLHLAYEVALATGNEHVLLEVAPYAAAHLRRSITADPDGRVPNLSFYPDRPIAFGRTEQSVVALEVGCLYAFTRLMENVAIRMGDRLLGREAQQYAIRIEGAFRTTFWDDRVGYFVDSVELDTGLRNASFPLFSLLFLQSAAGVCLVRDVLPEISRFLAEELQIDAGTCLIPQHDDRRSEEDALGSWYPHWDIYLLKVLRRAGKAEAIERWARSAETVLCRLGYVPEFIVLDGLGPDPGPAWLRHGSVANLNCATGWFRGILEGLFGIETDPGGLTLVPLGLHIGRLAMQGYDFRGTRWDFVVHHGGPVVEEITIDGARMTGCLKVPAYYQDGGAHILSVRYGTVPGPFPVRELINAELLSASMQDATLCVRFLSLGLTDLVLDVPTGADGHLDGVPVRAVREAGSARVWLRIEGTGAHELVLSS